MPAMNLARFLQTFGILLVLACLLALQGCATYGESDGQVVEVSRGKGSFFQQMFGGQGDFCRIATTPGLVLKDEDRAAFRTYCLAPQERLVDALREAGIGQ